MSGSQAHYSGNSRASPSSSSIARVSDSSTAHGSMASLNSAKLSFRHKNTPVLPPAGVRGTEAFRLVNANAQQSLPPVTPPNGYRDITEISSASRASLGRGLALNQWLAEIPQNKLNSAVVGGNTATVRKFSRELQPVPGQSVKEEQWDTDLTVAPVAMQVEEILGARFQDSISSGYSSDNFREQVLRQSRLDSSGPVSSSSTRSLAMSYDGTIQSHDDCLTDGVTQYNADEDGLSDADDKHGSIAGCKHVSSTEQHCNADKQVDDGESGDNISLGDLLIITDTEDGEFKVAAPDARHCKNLLASNQVLSNKRDCRNFKLMNSSKTDGKNSLFKLRSMASSLNKEEWRNYPMMDGPPDIQSRKEFPALQRLNLRKP